MKTDRRDFLKLLAVGALAGTFPPSILRALEIPAHRQPRDVEHIVTLMQGI